MVGVLSVSNDLEIKLQVSVLCFESVVAEHPFNALV